MKNKLSFFMTCSYLFILFFTINVSATLNVSLSNQGTNVTTISTGSVLASGDLVVTVYDALTGGNLIYNETFTGAIVNGDWNVMLGENSSNPLPLEFGRIYYYDYEIEGSDVNFTIFNGTVVGRQFFYSPLGDISDEDISDSTNLTLGEKITFTFGEIIDNIVDGFIRITGGLNVTGDLIVEGDLNVSGDINFTGIIYGNGSGLTGIGAISLLADSINTTHILDGTILADDLANGSVTNSKIAANAINTTHIVDGTILTEDIADNNITAAKIAPDSINGTELADTLTLDANLNINGGFDFSVNNSDLYVDVSTGSVGIGTSSPDTFLDVSGSATATDSLRLRSGDNAGAIPDSNQILFSWNGDVFYTHAIKTRHNANAVTGNAIDFYVWDFLTDAVGDVGTLHTMTLENGNVGIGTTSPTQKLDVNGSVNISGIYYGDGSGLTNISGSALGEGSINTTHILDSTIVDADINDSTNLTMMVRKCLLLKMVLIMKFMSMF